RVPRVPARARRRADQGRARSRSARRRSGLGVTLVELVTSLVQAAPARDPGTIGDLLDGLRRHGSRLALSIARIVELVDEDLVDPGVALPALAEAIDALVDPGADRASLEAAQYRIDTLEPRPDPPPRIAAPDVTVDALL